ncbi:MAG: FAD-dependent thymidylate synthase [Dehalococcoidia bacterium]|nr:FAD-dependent thymidylate synthase [Dehalococcoidia bacterium]
MDLTAEFADTSFSYPRRIYPLSPRELTEEQLAVVFAMTSRRPEPFDEIANQVSREKAADFHERWVLGYGHASVAEHAVIHMAVENISRLACDSLEDNRLASYTEKSSRFQVMSDGYYYVPKELATSPDAQEVYIKTCQHLFRAYQDAVKRVEEHLRATIERRENERESAYNLRLRRDAIDSCRFLLPAATLTNVGVTMNARLMEHAIAKLLSSELTEEQELGEELKSTGREITPTLIKYAENNDYLAATRAEQQKRSSLPGLSGAPFTGEGEAGRNSLRRQVEVSLVDHDSQAELKLCAALLYRFADLPYAHVWKQVEGMGQERRHEVIASCLEKLGPHDPPVRELEMVDYTFELVMDYGAYREFKRHRMQTYIPQPLTVANGYLTPPLLEDAGIKGEFVEAMELAGKAFREVYEVSPAAAQYLVTHAHKRRVLAKMNLRECYHLFKLRTQPQAHFSIREPIEEAMRLAVNTHPGLFEHLRLRKFPDWWSDHYGS